MRRLFSHVSSLTLFLQPLQKGQDLLELSNFGNPSGSWEKKSYKRVISTYISDKWVKKTITTRRIIISSISSVEPRWKAC